MIEKKRNNSGRVLPELLAPAGNLEKLKTAVHYGADAVYLGGKELSLRAKAGNFTPEQLREGVQYSHAHNVQVYVTLNVLAHNEDIGVVPEYVDLLRESGVDGVIISDPGILKIVQKTCPDLNIHLSTQANVTNYGSAQFWLEQGVSRLNLARELSLEEISEIRKRVEGELEVFVHGAICISYSGRCMLSNYLTNRDANRGNCSHPCRFSYALMEEKRPDQYFPVDEDGRGTYIFNSKDLCLLPHLPKLVASGVDSLKIEGRMKSIFYVGGVVRIYRAALDFLASLDASAWQRPEEIEIPNILLDEIAKTGTRGTTDNFLFGKPTNADMLYNESRADQIVEPVAVVRKQASAPLVEIRNKLRVGETIEYMGRDMYQKEVIICSMENEEGISLDSANPGNMVYLKTNPDLPDAEVYGMLRREKS